MWSVKYFTKKENDWIKPKDFTANYLHSCWMPNGCYTDLTNQSDYLCGYYSELKNFACSVLANKEPASNLEDGFKALQIAEAVYESSKNKGKKIEIT